MTDLLSTSDVRQILQEAFDELGINAQFTNKAGGFVLECIYKTDAYPVDLDLIVDVYPNGFVAANFFFDLVEINEKSLKSVNKFNHDVLGFKAHLRGDGCLIVTAETLVQTRDAFALYIKTVLEKIVSDDAVYYLLPIIKLAYK